MPEDILEDSVAAYVQWALKHRSYPQFVNKWISKAGNVSGLAGAINVTYGALVYDHINREVNAHAIIKKEVWERSGFRVTTSDPATKLYGGADPGTVGAVIDVNPTELKSIPAFLHTPFDLTMDAGFRATHDDGLDVWEWKLAIMRDLHAQGINLQLLLNAEYQKEGNGGNNTTDAKNDANGTGKGLETLDRAIAAKGEEDDVGGAQLATTGWYDLYEGDVDRDAATTFDSVVVKPDGSLNTVAGTDYTVDIPFQITGLDALIDQTENNGADPTAQTFLTGRETTRSFYNELQAAGRYDLTTVEAKLDMGGLSPTATHPGRDISFTIRAYQDRPFVRDKNVPKEGTSGSPSGSPRVYLMDQRHIHMKVGFPTLYVDVDNPVIRGQFDTKALYLTCEQLYLTRFNTSGKMRSIS